MTLLERKTEGSVHYNLFSKHYHVLFYGDLGNGYEKNYLQVMARHRLEVEARVGRFMLGARR